jgi:maltoporin
MIHSRTKTLCRYLAAVTASVAAFSTPAHAELSIGALAGINDFTSQVRGNAVYSYGSYYAYPQDINKRQGAIGVVGRYLYPVKDAVFIGAETGYVYLGIDETRLRSNDYITVNPQWVENFTAQATGLVLLNAVAGVQILPTVKFMIFGGPAWLNTKYIANDFFDQYAVTANSTYQSTADLGAEVDWSFLESWSAGMRYDYIFKTDKRTVASIGADGTAMQMPTTAKSSLTLFTFTLRYLVPNT